MPAGRPTKYDPTKPDELRKWMAQGYSMTAAAGKMGVCHETVSNWARAHPEFLAALKEGHAARLGFWEDRGMSDEGAPAMTIFALKNASRVAAAHEWKNIDQVEHSGPDGAELVITYRDKLKAALGDDA